MKLLTQPYLLTLHPAEEMNIVWIQSAPSPAYVEYGRTDALGTRAEARCYEIRGFRGPGADGTYGDSPYTHPEVSVWQYIVKLSDLSPGETIHYRVFGCGEYSKVYFFHTAPSEGSDYRFVQISDLQSLPNCDHTVHNIGTFHPDFILFSGDAAYVSWRLDQWFDTGEAWQDELSVKSAFFPCMQQENGARLMQYAPLFFSPGNHEPDDMKCGRLPEGEGKDAWSWSIFMQLFRPLYPDSDYGINGKRWYSADYADMHIVSLSINRFSHINAYGKNEYILLDSFTPGSPQLTWLEEDLSHDNSRYRWVIQHFHILNRAWDAKFNLCAPETDDEGNAIYPHDGGQQLIDLFSAHRINAVTYGHSHVYERYYTQGTHYIEAAYLSITFAKPDSPPHPSGLLPVLEDNSRRSFAIFERRSDGLFAEGYYAAENPIVFDRYQIANSDGTPVSPDTLTSVFKPIDQEELP